jgi:uncharacterized membrane protein YraQ (UPF0718 family)
MHELAHGVSRFASLTLSVLPWLAIGVAAAAVVQTFVPQRWAARALGGRAGLPVASARRRSRCRSRVLPSVTLTASKR